MTISKVIQSKRMLIDIINNTLLEDSFIEKKFEGISILQSSEMEIVIDATEAIAGRYSISLEGDTVNIKGSAKSIETAIEKFVEICNNDEIELLTEKTIEGYIEIPKMYTKDELFTVLQRVYDDKEHTGSGKQGLLYIILRKSV